MWLAFTKQKQIKKKLKNIFLKELSRGSFLKENCGVLIS